MQSRGIRQRLAALHGGLKSRRSLRGYGGSFRDFTESVLGDGDDLHQTIAKFLMYFAVEDGQFNECVAAIELVMLLYEDVNGVALSKRDLMDLHAALQAPTHDALVAWAEAR